MSLLSRTSYVVGFGRTRSAPTDFRRTPLQGRSSPRSLHSMLTSPRIRMQTLSRDGGASSGGSSTRRRTGGQSRGRPGARRRSKSGSKRRMRSVGSGRQNERRKIRQGRSNHYGKGECKVQGCTKEENNSGVWDFVYRLVIVLFLV